jgi:hypothetical protein
VADEKPISAAPSIAGMTPTQQTISLTEGPGAMHPPAPTNPAYGMQDMTKVPLNPFTNQYEPEQPATTTKPTGLPPAVGGPNASKPKKSAAGRMLDALTAPGMLLDPASSDTGASRSELATEKDLPGVKAARLLHERGLFDVGTATGAEDATSRGLSKFATGMIRPESLLLLTGGGVFEGIPQVARAGMSAVFGAQMAHQLVNQSPEFVRAVKQQDWDKAVEIGSEMIPTAAMTFQSGLHAFNEAGGAVHEAGAKARENMAVRKEANLADARSGKVITIEPQKALPEATKQLPAAPDPDAFAEAGGKLVVPTPKETAPKSETTTSTEPAGIKPGDVVTVNQSPVYSGFDAKKPVQNMRVVHVQGGDYYLKPIGTPEEIEGQRGIVVLQHELGPKVTPEAAPIKISTDTNGVKWAENADGIRVSVPQRIPEAQVQEYAAQQIDAQAKMQAAIKAKTAPAAEWQPPANLAKGISKDAAVDTQIPIQNISVSPQAYSRASSDIAKGRGSKTSEPVQIFYNPDNGQYLVEDGMHRVVEAHQRGETHIPAKLWSGYSDTIANVRGEKMDLSPEEPETDPIESLIMSDKIGGKKVKGVIPKDVSNKAIPKKNQGSDSEVLAGGGWLLPNGQNYVHTEDKLDHSDTARKLGFSGTEEALKRGAVRITIDNSRKHTPTTTLEVFEITDANKTRLLDVLSVAPQEDPVVLGYGVKREKEFDGPEEAIDWVDRQIPRNLVEPEPRDKKFAEAGGKLVSKAPTAVPLYSKEGAQKLADHIGAQVVGSVAETGASTHDLDLAVDNYDQPKIEAAMKVKGFEPVGSSVVSPAEAKKSGKNFGNLTDWHRAHHFESVSEPRQKVDIWHNEPDIEDSDIVSPELQTPHKETYRMEVTNQDGMSHKVDVDAHSPKQALAAIQKQFPSASEWRLDTMPENVAHSAEYSVPTGKIQKMKYSAGRPEVHTIIHELGHALVGQAEGLAQEGILSSSHPRMPKDARAGVLWPSREIFTPGTRQVIPTQVAPVVRSLMGGIAADEAFNDLPRAANNNLLIRAGGDGARAYQILRAADMDHTAAMEFMHKAIDYGKEYLLRPEVSSVLQENAGVRELGLSRQYHASPERLQAMHQEIQRRIANAKEQSAGTGKLDNGTTGGRGSEVGPTDVARGEGGSSQGPMGKSAETKEGIVDEDKIKPSEKDFQRAVEDYRERQDQVANNIIEEYGKSIGKDGYRQRWSLVPAGRLTKIWNDYAKLGFVRDEKGIDNIADTVLENIHKIQVNNVLTGHSEESIEDFTDRILGEKHDADYYSELSPSFFDDEKGNWRLTDFAANKLADGAITLMRAKTPEEKLQAIDHILNIVHQRSDLSSWFVEGGQKTLNAIAGRPSDDVVSEEKDNKTPPDAVGLHPDDLPSRAKYQDVRWNAQDLQDADKKVDERTIRRDYANNRKDVSIYQSYIPMEDLPSPAFPQGDTPEDEEGENFDRPDYSHPRSPVPIKVSVHPDGKMEILDGNHRAQVWGEQDQQYAPAWVVDYRHPDIENLSEDEKAERAEEEVEAAQLPQNGQPFRAYHGTTASTNFNEFSTEGRTTDEKTGEPTTSGSGPDPTSYLGAHFSAEPETANKFATRQTSWMKSRYEAGEGEEGAAGPRVIPVDLKFKKIMNFGPESNMRGILYSGNLTDAGYAGEELLNAAMRADDIDDEEIQDNGPAAEKWLKQYNSDLSFRQQQNRWLFETYRPEEGEDELLHDGAAELATQARHLLTDAGYDGASYKNEVEGGLSYVAFSPKTITSPFKAETPKVVHGNSEEFAAAVQNTAGAKINGKELTVRAERYQKPEQAGSPSVRTGVFYSPEPKSPYSKYYKSGKMGYGGTQRIEGDITFKNPIVAKGASGGKVPQRAYDAIQGKGAYDAMRNDVLQHISFGSAREHLSSTGEFLENVTDILKKYGADPDNADYIIQHSKFGNTLAYAIQENIVAHALRAAGYDGIVGYNKIKGQHRLSEVFHITQDTYPEGE